MARILIVAGGARGRLLGAGLHEAGHAVRITTRSERSRAAIEQAGAECWIGTPDRLATLRGALDGVTIACWLLGTATGSEDELRALAGPRLELFLTQAIDTTMRGFVYEARGVAAAAGPAVEGALLARRLTVHNQIPARFLELSPDAGTAWQQAARDAVEELLDAHRG